MSRLVVRCPAKVNLRLRVVGRRSDGYHGLDTVFQAIALWDRLEVEVLPDGEATTLSVDRDDVPDGDENLVLRAAAALGRRFPERVRPVRFRLSKRIPARGGLGGGSSDAAGALRALDRLWGLDAGDEALHEVARELGADVPFFLVGGTAHGVGRGDRLAPIPSLGPRPIVLGLPPFGVSTAEAFAGLADLLTLPGIDDSFPDPGGVKWPEAKDLDASTSFVNDLERSVFPRRPTLRRFVEELRRHGASLAMMSGSGSSVFGLFDDEPSAERAERRLRTWAADERDFRDWSVLRTVTTDGGVEVESVRGDDA